MNLAEAKYVRQCQICQQCKVEQRLPAVRIGSSLTNGVQKLTELHRLAAQKLKQEKKRQARYFNAHRREVPFREGDLVWKRNKILSSTA